MNNGEEYTEQYTISERLTRIFPLGVVGFISIYFVFYELDEFLETAHCYEVFSINGFYWFWGALFTIAPAVLFFSVLIVEGKSCVFALKKGRYPDYNGLRGDPAQ